MQMKGILLIFNIHLTKPEVFCKLFEDNQSYNAVTESNCFSPITKHIAIKYHHFWSSMQNEIICICYMDTREQIVEIFTKQLDEELFIYPWIKNIIMVKTLLQNKEVLEYRHQNQTHKRPNWSGCWYLEMPKKRFYYH